MDAPSPLSIGLFAPGWPPETMANGVTSYVGAIAGALRNDGVACHVLTMDQGKPADDNPFVHVIRIDHSSLLARFMWRFWPDAWLHYSQGTALRRMARRLARERTIDLVEIEESFGFPTYLTGGRAGVPVVVRLHGPWFLNGIANGVAQDKAFARRDAMERAAIQAADGVTAPSQHVLDAVRAHYRIPLPNARVIPNPVQPVAVAGRWNLQDCDHNRIAFVGRFDRHKGGDTMIDAFARVLNKRPEVRLDFVGPDRGCRDQNGREIKFDQYLRSKLDDAQRARVTYHGFLPADEAARLRKRALVTVAPSRYETFGIAAAEAMMAGCPLVVSAAGALTELVQHGRNGLTARPDDPADLAEQLLALLGDANRAASLGRQAAEDAAGRYAPARVARETIDFYRQVVSAASRPSNAVAHSPAPERPAGMSA